MMDVAFSTTTQIDASTTVTAFSTSVIDIPALEWGFGIIILILALQLALRLWR